MISALSPATSRSIWPEVEFYPVPNTRIANLLIAVGLVLMFGLLLGVHHKFQDLGTVYQFDHRGGYQLDLGIYPPPFVHLQLKGDGQGAATCFLDYSCPPFEERKGNFSSSGEMRQFEGQLTRDEAEEFLSYLSAHDVFRQEPGPSPAPGQRMGSVRVLSTPSFTRTLSVEEVEKLFAGSPVLGEKLRQALAESQRCALHRFDELAVEVFSLRMTREQARALAQQQQTCPDYSRIGRLQAGTAACLWTPWENLWSCSGRELSAGGKIVLRAGQEQAAVRAAMGPPARTEGQTLFYEWRPYQVLAVNLRDGRVESFCLSDSSWVVQQGGQYDPRTTDFPTGLHD